MNGESNKKKSRTPEIMHFAQQMVETFSDWQTTYLCVSICAFLGEISSIIIIIKIIGGFNLYLCVLEEEELQLPSPLLRLISVRLAGSQSIAKCKQTLGRRWTLL